MEPWREVHITLCGRRWGCLALGCPADQSLRGGVYYKHSMMVSSFGAAVYGQSHVEASAVRMIFSGIEYVPGQHGAGQAVIVCSSEYPYNCAFQTIVIVSPLVYDVTMEDPTRVKMARFPFCQVSIARPSDYWSCHIRASMIEQPRRNHLQRSQERVEGMITWTLHVFHVT